MGNEVREGTLPPPGAPEVTSGSVGIAALAGQCAKGAGIESGPDGNGDCHVIVVQEQRCTLFELY